MISKKDEKELYASFIKQSPTLGYVRALLIEMQPAIEKAIDDDLCVLLYPAHKRLTDQRIHEETIHGLVRQQEALRAQIRALNELRARTEVQLQNIASIATNIVTDCRKVVK